MMGVAELKLHCLVRSVQSEAFISTINARDALAVRLALGAKVYPVLYQQHQVYNLPLGAFVGN